MDIMTITRIIPLLLILDSAAQANAQQVAPTVEKFLHVVPSTAVSAASLVPLPPVAGIDDLQAIGAVIESIASIKQLFSSGSDLDQINRKIDELSRQNAEIINRLDAIVDVLNNLNVVVRSAVHDEFVNFLRSDISASMLLYYETVRALNNNPSYATTARVRFQENLGHLRRITRQISGYGFGVFPTMSVAMYFEDDLEKKIGSDKEERRAALGFYRDWFASLLDAGTVGALPNVLNSTQTTLSSTNQILGAADSFFQTHSTFYVSSQVVGDQSPDCWDYETHDLMQRVSGDHNAGYTISTFIVAHDHRRGCQPHGGHGGRLGDRLARASEIMLPPSVPQSDQGDQSPRVAYLNALIKTSRALADQVVELQKSIELATATKADIDQRLVGLDRQQ